MHVDLGSGNPHEHFLARYYASNSGFRWVCCRNFIQDSRRLWIFQGRPAPELHNRFGKLGMACSRSNEIVELRLPALPPESSFPQVIRDFLTWNVAGEVPEAQACNRKTYVTPSEGSRHTNCVYLFALVRRVK